MTCLNNIKKYSYCCSQFFDFSFFGKAQSYVHRQGLLDNQKNYKLSADLSYLYISYLDHFDVYLKDIGKLSDVGLFIDWYEDFVQQILKIVS